MIIYGGESRDDFPQPKQIMSLKAGNAFIMSKDYYKQEEEEKTLQKGDQWNEEDKEYRVGIQMMGRKMKPVYYYFDNVHDA